MSATSQRGRVDRVRRRLGPVGAWLPPALFDSATPDEIRRTVQRLADGRYGAVFTGERLTGGEIFARMGTLLAADERPVIGAGIANSRRREPAAMAGGAATLAHFHPGRTVLGIGVGHLDVVAATDRPLERMRAYLNQMDRDQMDRELQPTPSEPATRVLAALGPRMLELAAEWTDGAHPFFVPVEHTASARRALGPDRLLIPQQGIVLDADRDRARRHIRDVMGPFFAHATDSPYGRNLERFGFSGADLGTDRMIDALFACGDEDVIAARVHEHLDAGADHVLLQPIGVDLASSVDQLTRLTFVATDRKDG